MRTQRFFFGSLGVLALAIAFAVFFQAAGLQAKAAPQPLASSTAVKLQEEFAAVAAKVNPTVVNIDVTKPVDMPQGYQYWQWGVPGENMPLPPQFRDFFNFRGFPGGPARPQPEPKEAPKAHGVGSGVIIDAENGYILTNNHVVEDATEIGVTLIDGKRYDAELVGADPRTDLAVIQIKAKGAKQIEWGDSDNLQVGHWVLAFGEPEGLKYTVTAGIVSAKGRVNLGIIGAPGGITGYENFIQTDAAINPGNSGGPLTDIHGWLVGINTAIATKGVPQFMGISFAIPSNVAKRISKELIDKGEIVRGWLGVSIGDLADQPDETRQKYGKDAKGIYVSSVEPGQPAEEAGIRPDDVIVSYDANMIEGVQHLRHLVAETPVGTQVKVEVIRIVDEKPRKESLVVKIGKQPADLAKATAGAGVVTTDIGLSVQTLTPDMAAALGSARDDTGAVVTEVKKGSRAAAADIKSGDVITEVRYRGKAVAVKSAGDFDKALGNVPQGESFVITRKRAGVAKFITVE
ncbi:MAG: trypsin-like peptidase domain-containing protein [Planctomycetes bacterium]|nr:trypsin-like peptidase domain-containing protein [Planctomycetota bacterium]